MFYHTLSFPTETSTTPPRKWWCLHAETFTHIIISSHNDPARPGTFSFTVVSPPTDFKPIACSHPGPFSDEIITSHLLPELGTIIPAPRLGRIDHLPFAKAQVPEYLLVWDIHGRHPAIVRCADPMLIIPANPEKVISLAAATPYYRTATDIPSEGWAYWWEDAHRAYDDFIRPLTDNPQHK